ncbi:MAG TPA: phosphoserine phosphatase SerB [Stellaceae bacterium]|nr:phosphoserine phosphatase SerB [Stellaceae bacterium]
MNGNVLTLIARETAERWVAEASAALERLGARLGDTDWLAPGQACDIGFDGLDPDQAEAAVRSALTLGLDGPAVDVVVQSAAGRKKKLLVADMESTIIENEMLDELAELIGLKDRVAAVTRQAMNDEIDFTTALKERVALFKGKPAALLDAAAAQIRPMPGAAALVATMRANGAFTALVSGGFRVFSERVRLRLGFDRDFANILVVDQGRLAGNVAEPILTRDGKLQILTSLAAEHGLSFSQTCAVGDGANDLQMIGAAGLGVAFRSHPNVAPRARHRIDHADLTALLYVQGYRRSEFVNG